MNLELTCSCLHCRRPKTAAQRPGGEIITRTASTTVSTALVYMHTGILAELTVNAIQVIVRPFSELTDKRQQK